MSLVRRLAVGVVILAAVALVLVPVETTYINRVDIDLVEFRTASCGSPVASLLGADPELGGGSEFPMGGETSSTACGEVSGKRAVGALSLLLAASLGWGFSRRRPPSADGPGESAAA